MGICQVLSTGAFTLFCHDVHGFTEDFLSFVTFVFVSCSHVCLLVVSRLLGLTLRHFAPVCSCHQDSLTRGRLAFEQEAVRVSSSLSSRLVSARDDMCLVVSGSLRERSLHAMLKFEGLAAIVKLFSTLSSFPCILHSFRPYIRDTLGRARNVIHLGALSVPSRIGGGRFIRASLTLIRCVVFFFRAIKWLLFSHCSIWLVLELSFLLCYYAKLGLSMEPLLDPCRESFKKGLLGGVDFRRRRLFRRTKCYGFPCAPQH